MFFKKDSSMTPIKGKRILIVSDIHFPLIEAERAILKNNFDMCWVLGDVPKDVLTLLDDEEYPIYGVLGNHDVANTFSGLFIFNLNGCSEPAQGIRLAGIEGSSKYKESFHVMLTQEESLKLAERTPHADVLLSHDSAFHVHDTSPNKEGLKGITQYLKKKKPKLHVYGHHHVHKIYKLHKTMCICNYRIGIIDVDGKYYTMEEWQSPA